MRAAGRRALAFALAGLTVAAAAPVRAQDDLLVSVQVGGAAPVAPPEFPDFWNPGWSLGGGVGFALTPEWEVTVNAQYSRFGADERGQIEDLLISGPSGTSEIASLDGRAAGALALTADARLHWRTLAAPVSPFLAFGAGFFSLATSEAVIRAVDPSFPEIRLPGETDAGLAASTGVGCRWRLAEGRYVSVESVYVIGFTEGASTQILPLRVGFAQRL